MATSDTRTMQIGNATIRITNDHEFFNGWQSGYLAFRTADRQTYSDADILFLLQSRIMDHTNSPLYNAGYVTAWLDGLMGHGFQLLAPERSAAQRAPCNPSSEPCAARPPRTTGSRLANQAGIGVRCAVWCPGCTKRYPSGARLRRCQQHKEATP